MSVFDNVTLYHCTINKECTKALCGRDVGRPNKIRHVCLRSEYWKDGWVNCQDCTNHPDYSLLLLAVV